MKSLKSTILLMLIGMSSIFAQIPDDLMPRQQNKYPKIDNWNIAVFPIDFADVPAQYKDSFPTKVEWEQTLFQGNISEWFQSISYGTTTITGDVFDYNTSSDVFFDGSSVVDYQDVLNNIDITAPGFDINSYDFVVFITCHDAAVDQSITGPKNFTINGTAISQNVVCTSYQCGIWWRDAAHYAYNNQLTDSLEYVLPTATEVAEESVTTYKMSYFEGVLLHELGHSLGLDHHANTSTNGNQPAYATEVANNEDFLNLDYGNKYELMGSRQYGITMNGAMRDYCGFLDSSAIYSKNWWGTTTITVQPITNGTGKRYIEVLLPDEVDFMGYKNHGFGLEVRTLSDYNTMLNNPELSENLNGFFVYKVNGTENLLLDMSPSDNIVYQGATRTDIRDMVLKPGMVYEDDDVKLENVVNNGDGTWSIDITIKSTLIVTPAPTYTSASRELNGDITINWTNNCTDCQTDQYFSFFYRKVGDTSWEMLSGADLNTGTFTTSDFSSNTDIYEFRGGIGENTTHYSSLNSNTVSTGASGIYISKKSSFKIYPNPANKQLNIKDAELEWLTITDISGNIVKQGKIDNYLYTIQISNLQNGIYFIKIGNSVQKFIKK